MSDPVLDTMVLQALGCGHPSGLSILFRALNVSRLRFPPEVYNQDEDSVPLERRDRGISEFGRGLRFARRRASDLPASEASRYRTWLENAGQIGEYLEAGQLVIDSLEIPGLQQRENLKARFGIGTGEAACLALALEDAAPAIFVSSDQNACRVAARIGVPFLTLFDVLDRWIATTQPASTYFEEIVAGMVQARFQVPDANLQILRAKLEE